MKWTKRDLLIAVAITDVYNSKQLYDLYVQLNEDESLDSPFSIQDIQRLITSNCFKALLSLDFNKEIERLNNHRVKVITIDDVIYPQRLKEIYLPPIVLFYNGDISLLNQRLVGVVGSRDHSIYAKKCIQHIIPTLISNKIVVASGLARGVDTLAHTETLKRNGKTIAVVGNGLDICYPPENKEVYKNISTNGLLISEYPLGSRPMKFHFPYRNRIIAGISHGVCVIEAKQKSGSLITANIALSENRDVFAVPGSIFSVHSSGANQLIEAGAYLVTDGDSIVKNIHFFP